MSKQRSLEERLAEAKRKTEILEAKKQQKELAEKIKKLRKK